MPVTAGVADVVVSNCVLNLVPNKRNVINEIARVLKSNGHFSISDIVLEGELPANLKKAAEMYAGCVSGAIQKDEYMHLINEAGFEAVTIQKEREVIIPDDILCAYLTANEIEDFKNSGTGIYSITVFGRKPNCCTPGLGCC